MYKINNHTTKIFFDLEFTGLFQQSKIISIAFVAENGDSLYLEISDYNPSKTLLDTFIVTNIEKNLLLLDEPDNTSLFLDDDINIYKNKLENCKNKIFDWLSKFDYIEFWGDCLAYDWVLFCQIFGGALNIPKNIYYIPFDICTLFKINNMDPDINREEFIQDTMNTIHPFLLGKKHNCLFDAFVIKECYKQLEKK